MLQVSEILTSAQIRAIESGLITTGAISGGTLLERAGDQVVGAILLHWPELACRPGRRVVVLCGPGNNGGDGFVVARRLAGLGWRVDVLLAGEPAALPPDARLNHDRWLVLGPVTTDPSAIAPGADLVVDALFGTGLRRPLNALAAFLSVLRKAQRVVAVDVPSGLCADSGRVIGQDVQPATADLTVTFHRRKLGHLLDQGPSLCGQIVVADIGLPDAPSDQAAHEVTGADLRKSQGHKFNHGHALIVAGGSGHGGAARLAARSALRIGAGLVTVCPPQDAFGDHAGPPDALMRRRLDDAADLDALLEDDRISAVCLGPGCGVDRAETLLPTLLRSGRPSVLDADALTALAGQGDPFSGLHPGCVLTPHSGEFARLFPDLAKRLTTPASTGPAYSRVDAARDAAARASAVVLLKGPDTVIADPSGRAAVHSASDLPWLATAGAGDVLAGLITGLLARRWPPGDAAAGAVIAHAEAARSFGPGLIADDLPEAMPAALRSLQARFSSRA